MNLIKGYNKMNNSNETHYKTMLELYDSILCNKVENYISKVFINKQIINDVEVIDYAKNKLIEHAKPNSYKIVNMVNVIKSLTPKEIVILYNLYC